MRITITSLAGVVYKFAGRTVADDSKGIFRGRLLTQLNLARSFSALGSNLVTMTLHLINQDKVIPDNADLWGASVEAEAGGGQQWVGKVTAYESNADGKLIVTATERTAPELTQYLPDEFINLVTVTADVHSSALQVTIPIIIGGNATSPIAVKGILKSKADGIYYLCIGEIHEIVKVRVGDKTMTKAEAEAAGYMTYTGSASQATEPGIAYIQITDPDLRKNDDGSYVEIGAEVIGLKLGTHTVEECRNGARFLLWLLKTARTGVGGWGLGIAEADIDLATFATAITDIDAAGLKLDGSIYDRKAAQSWITEICRCIRGTYDIGENGKRRLYISKASDTSSYTYTKATIEPIRFGVGAYTGRVFNQGRLDYAYNPITGLFMQSAHFQDMASIANIEEQEFIGQSYLIRDPATAQKILEYTCKRSLVGASKVLFSSRFLPANCRPGQLITLEYPEHSLTGLWKITSLQIGDHVHRIEAEKFAPSIFDVGAPGTAIDWPQDAPIVSTINPGQPSGLTLATIIDYDSNGDGSARPFIEGSFVQPAGKYLGAAVFWGEGLTPAAWNSYGSIRGTTFKIGPVKAGQLYTVKLQLFNSSGASEAISGTITPGKHADLPPTPTVAAQAGFGCIVVSIDVAAFSALAEFEVHRQKGDGSGLTVVASRHRSTRLVDDSPEILTNYTQEYQYRVRAVSNSRQFSAWSDWSSAVSPVQVQSKDITDLPIIGKAFLTAADVGANADGVKFTAAGIEMWQTGLRKVLIPASGDPEFSGTIIASSGYIGGCVIEDGGLRSADFVSQHRGWSINKTGDAEFNNIRARGAVKTVVFEKDEISVVGGHTLIRPAELIASYDYDDFLDSAGNAALESAWLLLNSILDRSEVYARKEFADYADYEAIERECYHYVATALGYAEHTAGIAESEYTTGIMTAYFGDCWGLLNEILDSSIAAPTFTVANHAAFVALDKEYWEYVADAIDDPPAFEAAVGSGDTRITLESTDQFIVGDIIRIKDGLSSDYWGVITAISGKTISVSGRSGELFGFTPGQSLVSYGNAGKGGVLLDGQSPLIDVYTHDGKPWHGTDCRVRIGNLKGWGAINHDAYGIALGQPNGDFLQYDNISRTLTLRGAINITSGVGLENFAGVGALATANNLDDVVDGSTYKRTTQNEKTGAARAFSGLDSSNRLITAVIPATAVSPAGAGLYLGSNYLGFYSSGWKTYMDNAGNFALIGSGTHGLSWNANTGVLSITGTITVDASSNVAPGADVTANNTAYDTARVDGETASVVKNNAATALSNANTANNLIADIAADNKLTPVEKQDARREWEIIAAEKALNNAQAFEFVGFSAGIDEVDFSGATKDSYWTTCWNRLNDILGETNAVPVFPAQTYAAFLAEESAYYEMELGVIYDPPVLISVIGANNEYNTAFQALANYLNADMFWFGGIPSWLSDSNLGVTTSIVGATFRSKWRAYYDARTTLLNAISVRAKTLADAAQATAKIGVDHASTVHAPRDADHTQTTIDGGLVTTGTLQVMQGGTVAAGITGNTAGDTAVRFWAGEIFNNRGVAPFRVLQNGILYASGAIISGTLSCGTGSTIAGFTATTTDLTAGTGSNAVGISTDSSKKAFWAGHATPASAPFSVDRSGNLKAVSGIIAKYTIDGNDLLSAYISGSSVNRIRLEGAVDLNPCGIVLDAASVGTFTSGTTITTGAGNGSSFSSPIRTDVASSTYYGFYTTGKAYAGGGFSSPSDESVKSDVQPVNTLAKLKQLPVKSYVLDDYKIALKRREQAITQALKEDNKINLDELPPVPEENESLHYGAKKIGLMAAEFNDLFGTEGGSDTYDLGSAIGVALRAIQELSEIVDRQAGKIAELKQQRGEDEYFQ